VCCVIQVDNYAVFHANVCLMIIMIIIILPAGRSQICYTSVLFDTGPLVSKTASRCLP